MMQTCFRTMLCGLVCVLALIGDSVAAGDELGAATTEEVSLLVVGRSSSNIVRYDLGTGKATVIARTAAGVDQSASGTLTFPAAVSGSTSHHNCGESDLERPPLRSERRSSLPSRIAN